MTRRHSSFYFLLGFLFVALLLPCFAHAGNTSTSGVTAQTVIDRVRHDLDEPSIDYWTNTELLQWMNEAVQEIVYQTRCLETGTSTIVLSSSQSRTFSLSSLSWLDVEKVEYDSGVTWIHDVGTGATRFNPIYVYDLDRTQFVNIRGNNEKEQGNPKVFTVWNNSLYIWPTPDTTMSGTSLYIYYVPAPTGVTTVTNAIETPSYFDSAILDYVKGKALYKDQQREQGLFFLNSFYARIKTYLVNVLRRNVFSLQEMQQTAPAQ